MGGTGGILLLDHPSCKHQASKKHKNIIRTNLACLVFFLKEQLKPQLNHLSLPSPPPSQPEIVKTCILLMINVRHGRNLTGVRNKRIT